MNIKALLTICFCVVTASAVTAQNIIANQYSLGSTGNNGINNTLFEANGDYYHLISISFTSQSQSMGNISAPIRGRDFAVLSKYDANHNLLWSKSYGGDSTDIISSFVRVTDGFLLCGSSNSTVSGNKTIESNGKFHLWLFKLDFDGEILWQKGFFTDHHISFGRIRPISDSHFLISSYTDSGISGDKSSEGYGGLDCWLIKIDTDGNKIWDKSIGTEYNDYGFEIAGTFDNGDILLCTNSFWGASGAKTEENYGAQNYWMVRIEPVTGEIVWDKTVGSGGSGESLGSVSVHNNTIYMTVSSSGGATGLRTLPKKGYQDIWFVKLDGNGSILEQHCYGGSEYERGATFLLDDSNTILVISSDSDGSIDKNEDSRGELDLWLVKLDNQGNILTQKTIGGDKFELPTGAYKLTNNNYLITSMSRSGVSGEKTSPRISVSDTDAWIIEIDHVTLNVVNRFEEGNAYILYPNPSKDECNIKFEAPFALQNAQLFDLTGKLVLEQSYQLGEQTNFMFSTKGLPKGNYTLLLSGKNLQKAHQLAVE